MDGDEAGDICPKGLHKIGERLSRSHDWGVKCCTKCGIKTKPIPETYSQWKETKDSQSRRNNPQPKPPPPRPKQRPRGVNGTGSITAAEFQKAMGGKPASTPQPKPTSTAQPKPTSTPQPNKAYTKPAVCPPHDWEERVECVGLNDFVTEYGNCKICGVDYGSSKAQPVKQPAKPARTCPPHDWKCYGYVRALI